MSDYSSTEPPHQLLFRLSQSSLVLEHNDIRQVGKLCEMTKHFLLSRFRCFLASRRDQVVAVSIGNDTTLLSTR